jgi:hypothetical protein
MYTIQNWTIVPTLLSLKHVVDGFNVTNFIIVIMQSTICGNGGIFYTNVNFLKINMSFGVDGVCLFQGYHISVLFSLVSICSIHDCLEFVTWCIKQI